MAGTSTGARKGWLTRRGYMRFGGNPLHTRKQEFLTVEESARLRKMRGGKAQPKPPSNDYALGEYHAAMARHDYVRAARWAQHAGRPDLVSQAETATRPAPAAPAKSSGPVKGKRVRRP